MTKTMLGRWAALFTLLLQANAQLLSCSEVDCPMSYGTARCNIDNTTLKEIGVANFSSALSPDPFSWTIGYAPEAITNSTDQRRYYLGTPPALNLNSRTDVTGCALFFVGIEEGLSFGRPNGTSLDLATMSGTCADALGITCESDLTTQAHDLVTNLTASGDLRCPDLAQALQSSPPESCTKAGTWGNITAKVIAGPASSPVLRLSDCNPTINTTYDVRSIATFPKLGDGPFVYGITPLMTVFVANGDAIDVIASPEVHLECMKPMGDSPANQVVASGKGKTLVVRNSWPSMVAAVAGLLVMLLSTG
ncbi:uncharacterized protein Z519_09954 [Cladophialophora bantiana CBS 173.52]|uniref:Uncharacterized protein n=1 Tax=Cladophialophora bantiana (strain ATCC 10958 / CBS 173.52 / CDC B-1940 / NIH 8579) TaxID=1442370 RepID=A0A0D2FR81_CLAB1|nr:uncharacterized protein Z519_09954 [Cladophialophora bantiana CBS 173.52]KIW89102.1 hypothetical protein Z519_09954 [Cladophialophora bantiana CBS 173.52]